MGDRCKFCRALSPDRAHLKRHTDYRHAYRATYRLLKNLGGDR